METFWKGSIAQASGVVKYKLLAVEDMPRELIPAKNLWRDVDLKRFPDPTQVPGWLKVTLSMKFGDKDYYYPLSKTQVAAYLAGDEEKVVKGVLGIST